jgi:hypothetical protein
LRITLVERSQRLGGRAEICTEQSAAGAISPSAQPAAPDGVDPGPAVEPPHVLVRDAGEQAGPSTGSLAYANLHLGSADVGLAELFGPPATRRIEADGGLVMVGTEVKALTRVNGASVVRPQRHSRAQLGAHLVAGQLELRFLRPFQHPPGLAGPAVGARIRGSRASARACPPGCRVCIWPETG